MTVVGGRDDVEIEVRLGTAGDLEEAAELHKASILKLCAENYTPAQLTSWTEGLTPEGYKNLLSTREFFVAADSGEVRGFGVLDLKASIINATYVSPTAAGRGSVEHLSKRWCAWR